jgi:hypothetical protein
MAFMPKLGISIPYPELQRSDRINRFIFYISYMMPEKRRLREF